MRRENKQLVRDAFSRKIVGWASANNLRAELLLDALEMAVGQRRPKDVIHQSGLCANAVWRMGSQYTSVADGFFSEKKKQQNFHSLAPIPPGKHVCQWIKVFWFFF